MYDPEALRREFPMDLDETYDMLCNTPSDINEHLPTLRKYAWDCATVCELGVRGVVSTVALARGLGESSKCTQEDITPARKLYLYDIIPEIDLSRIESSCFQRGIDIHTRFGKSDLDFDNETETYDMLFIDSAHHYPQCYEELNKFGKKTKKYILFHDTADTTDGITSEMVRLRCEPQHYKAIVELFKGEYTEDDFKTGLNVAIGRWLEENLEWEVSETLQNNNGLTILKRI